MSTLVENGRPKPYLRTFEGKRGRKALIAWWRGFVMRQR